MGAAAVLAPVADMVADARRARGGVQDAALASASAARLGGADGIVRTGSPAHGGTSRRGGRGGRLSPGRQEGGAALAKAAYAGRRRGERTGSPAAAGAAGGRRGGSAGTRGAVVAWRAVCAGGVVGAELAPLRSRAGCQHFFPLWCALSNWQIDNFFCAVRQDAEPILRG